jgi:hypothetical protein
LRPYFSSNTERAFRNISRYMRAVELRLVSGAVYLLLRKLDQLADMADIPVLSGGSVSMAIAGVAHGDAEIHTVVHEPSNTLMSGI